MPYENVLQFPTCWRTIPSKKRFCSKSDLSLKTTIGEDAELCLPIWHCGTRKAFLMHVSTAITIKKRGTFKAHAEAHELYLEHRKVAKQAKAALAVLNASTREGEKTSKKASQKTKEGAASADAPNPELHAEYKKDF